MNEFENYMVVREKVSDLLEAISEIPESKERIDNIDYAIKMLQDLKAEEQ